MDSQPVAFLTAPNLSRRPLQLMLSGLALTASIQVQAQTELSAEFSLGIEHDSNVAVEEVDSSSDQGDQGRVVSAEFELAHKFTDKTKASISYNYNQIAYENFDDLSRTTHMLGANFSTAVGKVNTGISYFYIDALLDGDDFLTYQRASPWVSGFVSKRWFLRGAYVYGDKEIARRPGRDAKNDSAEFDAYYFWQGLRRYFNLGYSYRSEDSQADRFDYDAHLFKLRFVQRFQLFSALSTFEIGARYEQRDYSSVTPSIGEERDDDKLRLKAELEIPLGEKLSWEIYAGYNDYRSNLPSADYDQTVVGTKLVLAF